MICAWDTGFVGSVSLQIVAFKGPTKNYINNTWHMCVYVPVTFLNSNDGTCKRTDMMQQCNTSTSLYVIKLFITGVKAGLFEQKFNYRFSPMCNN